MLRQNRRTTTAVAITVLVIAGLAGPVDTHSLTKTVFAPTDDSVLFTHDFGEKGASPSSMIVHAPPTMRSTTAASSRTIQQ